MKLVYASDDGGLKWAPLATAGPMQWPQIFSCASGENAIAPTLLICRIQRLLSITEIKLRIAVHNPNPEPQLTPRYTPALVQCGLLLTKQRGLFSVSRAFMRLELRVPGVLLPAEV